MGSTSATKQTREEQRHEHSNILEVRCWGGGGGGVRGGGCWEGLH